MQKTVNNKVYKLVPMYNWCDGCVGDDDTELCAALLSGRDWARCTPDKIYVEVKDAENS